jgi:hypothetical protein
MPIPQYTRLRAYDTKTDFNNDQSEAIFRELSNNQVINGILLESISLIAGDNYTPHKLEREIKGWFIARAKSAPLQLLSGTIAPFSASATLVGTSTEFLTELVVGERIHIGPSGGGETRTVSAIASDTSLTVSTAFGASGGDPDPQKYVPIIIFDKQDDNTQSKNTLCLNCNVPLTVDIWVF